MTTPHRATPEQISMCVHPGDLATDPRKVIVMINALSDRIEALEAAQCYQFRSATEKVPTTRLYSYSVGPAKPLDELGQGHTLVSPEPTTTEHRPGGLVERVADILHVEAGFRDTGPDGSWDVEARAAIREVAKWLRAGRMLHAAELLEQETDR
jgi:hypothetical protein